VEIPERFFERLPNEALSVLREILAHDPRPAYQEDALRVYGMEFRDIEVKFSVADGVLTVLDLISGIGSS
jgi:hypothetical protein